MNDMENRFFTPIASANPDTIALVAEVLDIDKLSPLERKSAMTSRNVRRPTHVRATLDRRVLCKP